MIRQLLFGLLLLTLASCICAHSKKQGHRGKKRQFVNYGNEGEFGGMGNLFNRGFGGYLGEGENQMQSNGGMQLTENNMGGLSLGGGGGGELGGLGNIDALGGQIDNMQNIQGFFGQNSGTDMFGGGDAYGLGGQDQPINRGDSLFSSLANQDGDDTNSPFEGNYNLGDNMNGGSNDIGQMDMNSFDGGGGISNSLGSLTGGLAALDGLTGGGGGDDIGSRPSKPHKSPSAEMHDNGGDRQGIGLGDVQDMLSSELGQLDTSDEKLQKMLESGLQDSGDMDAPSSHGAHVTSPQNSDTASLFGAQDMMDAQPSNSPDELAGFGEGTSLNQLTGSMSANSMPIQPGETVYGHASDKPSGQDHSGATGKEEAKHIASQVQATAALQHKAKLKKLKTRLELLKSKLNQLQDEQSKKSNSNKNNDPKAARNDAIKKLLIKNLKLAAMIASKEIQLEEAKGRGLAYLTGKKDDNEPLVDDLTDDKNTVSFIKAKPLTELSKKAEEEVNHLSRNPDLDKLKNITVGKTNIATANNKTFNRQSVPVDKTLSGKSMSRMNETLQELGTSLKTHIHPRMSSKLFLGRLKKQISSMSPTKTEAMAEKALASLYTELQTKQLIEARKRSLVKAAFGKRKIFH